MIDTLENQTSELEDQIDELEEQLDDLEEQLELERKIDEGVVEITGIETRYKGNAIFVAHYDVYVTVKNYGVNDVSGLAVSTGIDAASPYNPESIEVLKAGETKTVTLSDRTNYDQYVFLLLNDEILDQTDF